MLKYSAPIFIVLLLLVAGCAAPPAETPSPEEIPEVKCRTVQVQEPAIVEECGPVSYTEEVCGKRILPYETIRIPKVDICSIDGPCAGIALADCPSCSKAMTRCVLAIRNLDPDKAGTWKVGANFSLRQTGFEKVAFIKDPITKSIKANSTETFDFHQFYAPGKPATSAECNLFIIEEPEIEDCHQETRIVTECKDVEKMATISKEICE